MSETREWHFEPALDAREQLRRWDTGQTIWSISLGGFGPGYEQSIQVLAIEIVRAEIDKPVPLDVPHNWGDDTIAWVDREREDGTYALGGLSGAQVGVAKSLALRWLVIGPAALLKEVDSKRHIQVSNYWPHVERRGA